MTCADFPLLAQKRSALLKIATEYNLKVGLSVAQNMGYGLMDGAELREETAPVKIKPY